MEGKTYRPLERSHARARVAPSWPAGARLALILPVLLALLAPAGTLFATPTPPVILANHETRECSQVIQGDDCSWCEPPAGWEVLGPAGSAPCPEGYAQVEPPEMECRLYETSFCCSGGVHRGYCENMVVDQAAASCGFVDDVQGCALPANWQSRPGDVPPQEWSCPAGYGWVQGEVACLAAQPGSPEPEQQAETPAPEPTPSVEDTGETWRGICVGLSCLVLVAVLFGFAAMFPVWYVQRQQERRTLPPDSRQ